MADRYSDQMTRRRALQPSVGSSGVVTFELPQREPIMLGGVRISPYLNVYTPVAFQPLGGDRAVVVPDFGLLAHQVNGLAKAMHGQGWDSTAFTTRRPTSTRSSISPPTSRSATPASWPWRFARAWSRPASS